MLQPVVLYLWRRDTDFYVQLTKEKLVWHQHQQQIDSDAKTRTAINLRHPSEHMFFFSMQKCTHILQNKNFDMITKSDCELLLMLPLFYHCIRFSFGFFATIMFGFLYLEYSLRENSFKFIQLGRAGNIEQLKKKILHGKSEIIELLLCLNISCGRL